VVQSHAFYDPIRPLLAAFIDWRTNDFCPTFGDEMKAAGIPSLPTSDRSGPGSPTGVTAGTLWTGTGVFGRQPDARSPAICGDGFCRRISHAQLSARRSQ
jgi:hypothetical protein